MSPLPTQHGRVMSLDELNRATFDVIDKDSNHRVSVAELRAALLAMGQVMSLNDVSQLIYEADEDHDGEIDRDEFAAMMCHNTRYLHA